MYLTPKIKKKKKRKKKKNLFKPSSTLHKRTFQKTVVYSASQESVWHCRNVENRTGPCSKTQIAKENKKKEQIEQRKEEQRMAQKFKDRSLWD